MDKYLLGLGSNLGDRQAFLVEGIHRLGVRGVAIDRVSSIYETEPVGYREQGNFLNLVVRVRWGGTPRGLLDIIGQVETECGRTRDRKDGPRTLDIDILLWEDRILREPGLRIPHPRMAERRFVLVPLVELIPDDLHPVLGASFRALLAGCGDPSAVHRLLPPPSLERGDPSGYNPTASRGENG